MIAIKPAVIGTCRHKYASESCEYILVGDKYNQVYEDFLGSCFDGFHYWQDDFMSIVLFTSQGKYRTADTGEIILKNNLGFRVIHNTEVFNQNYDY